MFSAKQKQALRLLERGGEVTNVLYGGAAGGGKSFFLCHWQIQRRLYNPETVGLIARNTLINLKKTTLNTFFRVWEGYYRNNPWGAEIRVNSQENKIEFTHNGSCIYLMGAEYKSTDPDGTDFGSLELTDAAIDEVNGCSEKYVDIIGSRIRWNLVNNRAPLLMTCNPGYDWVRRRFWKNSQDKPAILMPHEAVVFARLEDNPDPLFRANYTKQLNKLSQYDRERLLRGDWDAVRSAENPFLFAFDPDKHISSNISVNENLPIIVAIDFNINPFCCLFIQHSGKDAWVYDEVSILSGDLHKMANEITARVPQNKKGLLRICGDAMGKRGEISTRGHASNYLQLQKMLGLASGQFILPSNPTHENSRTDCNAAFARLNIQVSSKCQNTIADFRMVEVDNEGKIIKRNRDRLEQRADFLDCFRYFVNAILKRQLM